MQGSEPIKKPLLTFKIHAMLWLIFTLTLMITAILTWMYSKSPSANKLNVKANKENVAEVIPETNMQQRLNVVEDMNYYVAQVQSEKIIRDFGKYPEEFKDEKFFTANKNKWTLKVMTVEKSEVITDYLDGRDDRAKFAYFRHSNADEQVRYTLIYELVNNSKSAVRLLQDTDFRLPTSVEIVPEEMAKFSKIVDNYVRAEEVYDLSRSRPREVILKPTRRLLSVIHPKPKPKTENNVSSKKSKELATKKTTE